MVSVFVLQCWVAADYELSLVSSFCQDLFLSRSTTIYDGATSADQTLMMMNISKLKSGGQFGPDCQLFWHYGLAWVMASCIRHSRNGNLLMYSHMNIYEQDKHKSNFLSGSKLNKSSNWWVRCTLHFWAILDTRHLLIKEKGQCSQSSSVQTLTGQCSTGCHKLMTYNS